MFVDQISSVTRHRSLSSFFSLLGLVAMKRLAVLLLFILVYATSAGITRAPEPLAPLAIKAVIDDYFAKNVHEVEILSFGLKNGKAEETIERLLRLGIQSMPMRIISFAKISLQSDLWILSKPSILLFHSPENFNQTLPRIAFQHGFTSHPHLVYVPNATIKDIRVVSDKNNTIHKTIFLVNEMRGSIELATAFMFTPDACHTNQFKVINRFTRKNKWENSKFFVEKYSNFYGCTLEVDQKDKLLYDVLNFTQKVVEQPSEDTPVEFIFSLLSIELLSFYSSYVLFVDTQKIYIPPGELYGDYEKMFLPFDLSTWIAIGVTIFGSSTAILVIQWISPNNQEIYFGRNNHSPLMEFISIMINGSQVRRVIENVPRIFLLTFIFWSLIFRLGLVDS
jgi:hypothetical protein